MTQASKVWIDHRVRILSSTSESSSAPQAGSPALSQHAADDGKVTRSIAAISFTDNPRNVGLDELFPSVN